MIWVWFIGWFIAIGISEVLDPESTGWRRSLYIGFLLMEWPFHIGKLIGKRIQQQQEEEEP